MKKSQGNKKNRPRKPPSNKFGKTYRRWREYLDKSLDDVAKNCGSSKGALSEIETGQRDQANSTTEDIVENGLGIVLEIFHKYGPNPEESGIKKKK